MTDVNNLPSNIDDLRNMEGFDKLNKSKQEELENKLREQKKVCVSILKFEKQ